MIFSYLHPQVSSKHRHILKHNDQTLGAYLEVSDGLRSGKRPVATVSESCRRLGRSRAHGLKLFRV